MIRYLAESEKGRSEVLYREAFPEDPDAFVEYYYSYVTKDNKILVMEQEGEICSMLHLNPYRLSVGGIKTAAYYYVAVATGKEFRHRGMMRALLQKSLQDLRKEENPFTYLMPVNRAIYEPFDFRVVYRQRKTELPLNPEEANQKMSELFDVYTLRDDWYVEKMLEEARVCEGNPPFEIVPYIMARITHVEKMLSMLRSREARTWLLQIRDEIIPENNGLFLWEITPNFSRCHRWEEKDGIPESIGTAVKTDVAQLTEFVFGRSEIKGLEPVKKLSKICINESV